MIFKILTFLRVGYAAYWLKYAISMGSTMILGTIVFSVYLINAIFIYRRGVKSLQLAVALDILCILMWAVFAALFGSFYAWPFYVVIGFHLGMIYFIHKSVPGTKGTR